MVFRSRNLLRVAALALLTLLSFVPTQSAAAASGERCFPQTGFCIAGPIRTYWERNGGLAVFGYPIGPLGTETIEGTWTGPVQWFERDRLEDHSNEGKGVLAGRLGALLLESQGRSWHPGMPMPYNPECRYFTETGYNLCGTFRRYWERNGGLARFGYPITDPIQETLEGRTYWVQYFERRRMEEHPENAGTPYEVLLGLLGRDLYTALGQGGLDVPGGQQQMILDTAWEALKPNYARTPLAIGLVDVVGEYASALALPRGQRPIFVYLRWAAHRWQVAEATSMPSADLLRQRGIPESLWQASDAYYVVDGALAQLQDIRGDGTEGYVTRPRIAGGYARFWAAPAASENLDTVSMFFKREGDTWNFLTAGSAFPEENLRSLGVPQELWAYGEMVHGPME